MWNSSHRRGCPRFAGNHSDCAVETPQYYLIGGDGRPYGPARDETIRQWLREGRITGLTPANLVGTTDWRPLRDFPEFAGAVPPTAPPTQPTQPPTGVTMAPRRTHSLAAGGFVCGLLSVSCCACCASEPLALVGVILSLVALLEITRQPERFEGRGLAIAGIVLSTLGFLLGLIGTGAGIAASLADASRPHRFH